MKRVVLAGATACAVLAAGVSVATATPALPHDPWRICPEAIAGVERTNGIPKHLLSSIALAESGRKHPAFNRRMPWPWTVMAEGQGRYLPSKAAALAEVRQLQARGVRNIDVGCMQVNLYHHPAAFFSLEHAFDPATNVAYAAKFLRSLFDSSGSWQEAAGQYHSQTPEHKIPYRNRVLTIWNEQQRLEFTGATSFGSGPLTAGLDGGLVRGQRVRSPAMLMTMAERRVRAPTQMPLVHRGSEVERARSDPPGLVRLPPATESRSGVRTTASTRAPVRTLDQEAAFAARRAQYLQDLRSAVAEVRKSYVVQPVRGTGEKAYD